MKTVFAITGLALCLVLVTAAPENNAEGRSIEASAAENQVERDGKASGIKSSRTALIEIARELITKATSSSQVLSLNLTNLVILLVLKALLFGAGLFSFGFFKRSVDTSPMLFGGMTEGEVLLMMSYLMGDSSEKYDCMNRVACEDPAKAREYLTASKMLIKGAKMLKGVVPFDNKYENIVYGLQEAVEYSMGGGECSARYTCSHLSDPGTS